MGRVSRHKKIKAIDPFSKTGGVVDVTKGKSYDMPPSKSETMAVPNSLRDMMRLAALPQRDKAKPERKLSHIVAMPGESLKHYNNRVKAEMRKVIARERAEAGAVHKVSERRRDYLDAKKERKKAKRAAKAAAARQRQALAGGGTGGAGADSDSDDDGDDDDAARATGKSKSESAKATTAMDAGNDADDDDGSGSEYDGTGHTIDAVAPSLALQAAHLAHGGLAGKKRRRELAGGDARDGTAFPTDRVAFGERLEAPPTSLPLPRKAAKKGAQETAHSATSAAAKAAKAAKAARDRAYGGAGKGSSSTAGGGHGGGHGGGGDTEAAAAAAAAAARKAAMEKSRLDALRQQAQDAYKVMKAKRSEHMRAEAAAAAAAAAAAKGGKGGSKGAMKAGGGGGALVAPPAVMVPTGSVSGTVRAGIML